MINFKTLNRTLKYIFMYLIYINFKDLIIIIIAYEMYNIYKMFNTITGSTIIVYIFKKCILGCLFFELYLYCIKNKIGIYDIKQIFIILKTLSIICCIQQIKLHNLLLNYFKTN